MNKATHVRERGGHRSELKASTKVVFAMRLFACRFRSRVWRPTLVHTHYCDPHSLLALITRSFLPPLLPTHQLQMRQHVDASRVLVDKFVPVQSLQAPVVLEYPRIRSTDLLHAAVEQRFGGGVRGHGGGEGGCGRAVGGGEGCGGEGGTHVDAERGGFFQACLLGGGTAYARGSCGGGGGALEAEDGGGELDGVLGGREVVWDELGGGGGGKCCSWRLAAAVSVSRTRALNVRQ